MVFVFALYCTEYFLTSIHFFNRYESLVGTVGKKFQTKRKRKAIEEESSQSDGTEPEEDSIEKRAKRGFVKPRVSPKDEFEF